MATVVLSTASRWRCVFCATLLRPIVVHTGIDVCPDCWMEWKGRMPLVIRVDPEVNLWDLLAFVEQPADSWPS